MTSQGQIKRDIHSYLPMEEEEGDERKEILKEIERKASSRPAQI